MANITTYNNAPYFDDFQLKDNNNETPNDKNYLRILFQPGFAVQTRELNQLQSILQNQINQFGLGFFKDGQALATNAEPTFTDSVDYIEFEFTPVDGDENLTIDTLVSTLKLQKAIESRGENGGSAKILGVENFTNAAGVRKVRMHIQYEQSHKFVASDSLFWKDGKYKNALDVDFIANDPFGTITETGYGFSFAIAENIYFINGSFVHLPTTNRFYKKDTKDKIVRGDLVFKIVESVISAADDITLNDNANGSLNFAAPGANRYQIVLDPTFVTQDDVLYDLNLEQGKVSKPDSNTIGEIKRILTVRDNGVEVVANNSKSNLDNTLAARTYESDGNYILNPFKINFKYFLNDGEGNDGLYTEEYITNTGPFEIDSVDIAKNKYALEIDTAIAYVNGYRYTYPSKVVLMGDLPRDPVADTATGTDVDFSIRYGNYVEINYNDSPSNILLASTANRANKLKALVSIPGTDKIRGYLFDGVNHTSVFAQDGGYEAADVVTYTTDSTQIFELPYEGVKSVSKLKYQKIQEMQPTLGGGILTISVSGVESFEEIVDVESDEYVIIKNDVVVPTSDYTISEGANSTRVSFEAVNGAQDFAGLATDYRILAPITVEDTDGSKRRSKTLTRKRHKFTFPEADGGAVTYTTALDEDIHQDLMFDKNIKIFKGDVVNSTAAEQESEVAVAYFGDSNNIISVESDGLTNDYYETPILKLSASGNTGALILNKFIDGDENEGLQEYTLEYTHFEHSAEGEYFSRDSYSDDDISFCDIPFYNDRKVSDYVDFRVKKNAAGVADRATILRPNSVSTVSLDYYLNRIDKLIIDSEGDLRIIKGTSALEPTPPEAPNNSLELYEYFLPYFTCNIADINKKMFDHKRFTMSQIGNIDKRVDRIEYLTALSLLEKEAESLTVRNELNDEMFKNGFLVDNFSGHGVGDTSLTDYLVAVDKKESVLRPYYKQKNFKLYKSYNVEINPILRTNVGVSVDDYLNPSITYKYDAKNNYVPKNGLARSSDIYAKEFDDEFDSEITGIYTLYNAGYSAGRNNDARRELLDKDFAGWLYVQHRSGGGTAFRRIAPAKFEGEDFFRYEMYNKNQPYDGRPKYVSKGFSYVNNTVNFFEEVASSTWYEITYHTTNAVFIENSDTGLKPENGEGFTVDNVTSVQNIRETVDMFVGANPDVVLNPTESTRKEIIEKNDVDVQTGDLSEEQVSLWEGATETLVENKLVTETLNLQPFEVSTYVGTLTLSPSSDEWIDTERRPAVTINNNGAMDAIEFLANNTDVFEGVLGTEWNSWQTNWQSTRSTTVNFGRTTLQNRRWGRWGAGLLATWNGGTSTLTQTTTNQSRTGTVTTIGEDVITEDLGDRVVDINIVPFIRSRFVSFKATGMKPNTRLYAFFDDEDVTDYCAMSPEFVRFGRSTSRSFRGRGKPDSRRENDLPIRSNRINAFAEPLVTTLEAGDITGFFRIPNNSSLRFRTGVRQFKLTSSPNNNDDEADSIAESEYHARGLVSSKSRLIQSTRTPELEVEAVRQNRQFTTTRQRIVRRRRQWWRWRRDPIAQTFKIEETYTNGVFISDIDLFFAEKPSANMDVEVYIVPTELGIPTQEIIPGSRVKKANSQVKVSGREPEIASSIISSSNTTNFQFEHPVYLKSNTEYALVVSSNSTDYRVWTSVLGRTDLISGTTITDNPDVGVLLKSQNTRTWTPDQTRDLVFQINKCVFPTEEKTFTFNTTFARSDDSIETQDIGDFDFTAFNLFDENLLLPNTSINYNINFINQSGVVKSFNAIESRENYELKESIKNQNINNVQLTATLSTEDVNISPIIDLERISLLGLSNVNSRNTFSNDNDGLLVKANNGYITKNISLLTPGNILKVFASVHKPTDLAETDIRVFANFDNETEKYEVSTGTYITRRKYIEATIIKADEQPTSIIPIAKDESDYPRMEFEIRNNPNDDSPDAGNKEFQSARVKIVFVGLDNAKYCKVRNLIAIAATDV